MPWNILDHDVDIFIYVFISWSFKFYANSIQCNFHWPWRTKSMCISHTCSTFRKNLNSFFIVGTYIHIKREYLIYVVYSTTTISRVYNQVIWHTLFKKSNTKFVLSRLWGLQIQVWGCVFGNERDYFLPLLMLLYACMIIQITFYTAFFLLSKVSSTFSWLFRLIIM